jgi:hypothetical protein
LGIKNGAALPSIAFLTLAFATAETCLTEIDTGSAPYWWLGIVIRNPDSQITLAAAQKLATGVQSDVANSVAELRNGTAGIIFVGGHVTIGFAPPPETVIQE